MSNYDIRIFGDARVPIKTWTKNVPVEDGAIEQLRNLAKLPFIYEQVVAMPDVHQGMGATIGSVIATKGAIIPAAVGVDIGCGMRAGRLKDVTAKDIKGLEKEIFNLISRNVPHGRTDHGGQNDRGRWGRTPSHILKVWSKELEEGYTEIITCTPSIDRGNKTTHEHLGTLGTGNHFIEICLDGEDNVWIMLHSGSRGVGARIGNTFIKTAKELCQKWFIDLPDPNLAYLPEDTGAYDNYYHAVKWAQQYAFFNRKIMFDTVVEAVAEAIDYTPAVDWKVDCHHNYVDKEHHFGQNILVTRKGAIRARESDYGIIPGSMGRKSYIVQGLNNPESFTSCSHGAGRVMSRTKAKRTITIDDHIKATEGIVCLKDESVLDESVAAYKDIDQVMEAEKDLVEPIHVLKQVICVKGPSD